MIEIRITANNYKELNSDLQALLGFTKLTETVSAPIVSQQVVQASTDSFIENEDKGSMPEPQKKTKKKASKKTSPPTTSEEKSEVEEREAKEIKETKTAGSYTAEDTYKALQKVSEACGLSTAREMLSEFQADRISALQEKDYGDFISACEKAVAGK